MRERLKAGGQGDGRGWNGWMASLTGWTWVWTSSRSWWWTGKPGVLQSMGSQRVGHDWATELTDHRHVGVLSCVWFFVTPWTVAHQASLSMRFSRKEYWSKLPSPTPGGSCQPRDRTCVSCISCIGKWTLYHCTTWPHLKCLMSSTGHDEES